MTEETTKREPKPIPEEITTIEIPVPGVEGAVFKAYKVVMDDTTMTVPSLSKARALLARFQNPKARPIVDPEKRRAANTEGLISKLEKQLATVQKAINSPAKSLGIENPLRLFRTGMVDALEALGVTVELDDAESTEGDNEADDGFSNMEG